MNCISRSNVFCLKITTSLPSRLISFVRRFRLSSNLDSGKLIPNTTCPTLLQNSKTTYRVSALEQPKKSNFHLFEVSWVWRYRYLKLLIKFLRPIVSEKTFKKMNRVLKKEFDPPESVRGMTNLNKSLFHKTAKVLCVRVPVKSMSTFSKKMKNSVLKIPNIRAITEVEENDPERNEVKLVLLDPDKYFSVGDIKEEEKTLFKDLGIDLSAVKHFQIDLGYENWNASEILKSVLPANSDAVAGFSTIGHIAHFNLKKEVLEYKYLIGEVILDKIKNVRTAVNKLNTIDNTFRNFQMELLAGEENYVTTTRENGCTFEMDFSKVYWNSRLATEHSRIVGLCSPEGVVYDVFAGVGPFTVPLIRKRCTVLANDLNPESFKWLNSNIEANKHKGNVTTYNLDGREFISRVVKGDLICRWKNSADEQKSTDFIVVMNLPALAIDFLDAFVDVGKDLSEDHRMSEFVKMPLVFCYCFTKSEDAEADIKDRVAGAIGEQPEMEMSLFFVRNVAPNKDMYRLSFRLPREVVFRSCGSVQTECKTDDIPLSKKQKLS